MTDPTDPLLLVDPPPAEPAPMDAAAGQLADLVAALTAKSPITQDDAEIIASVAIARANDLIAPRRLAFVLAGLGWRETALGTTDDLDVFGAGGTGDHEVRAATAKHIADGRHQIHQGHETLPTWTDAKGRERHWVVPMVGTALHLAPPYAIPLDGRGFGRGKWQADFDAHPELVDATFPDGSPCWADARWLCNEICTIFLADLARLGKERMAMAAFNCSAKRVLASLDAGKGIDGFTRGGNYSQWVADHITAWGG